MPILDGRTLAAAMKANAQVPIPEVLRIGREMAEGLAAAHEKGLIHRDVKPANVWLEGDRRRVKILDFGLARATTEELADGDEPATKLGTAPYMSPEQGSGQPVDPRTDVFSLGVVLYQMTTGERPFVGKDMMALLTALAVHQPAPPREKNPAVPAALSKLIMRMLGKTPTERPSSAAAVADAIRMIEGELTRAPAAAAPPVANDPWADIDATEAGEIVRVASGAASACRDKVPTKSGLRRDACQTPWRLNAAAVLFALITATVAFFALKPPKEQAKADPAPTPRPGVIPKPNVPAPRPKSPMDDEGDPDPAPAQQEWKPDLNVGPGGFKFDKDGLARLTQLFTEGEAKQAHEAWAKELGRKVEETFDLGGGVMLTVVLIPTGTYLMGSPPSEGDRRADEVQHPVGITRPFYLGKYEVTQRQFEKVMGSNPSEFGPTGRGKDKIGVAHTSEYPVERGTWDKARRFGEKALLRLLGSGKGMGGLPTEAEWACRAGTTSRLYYGHDIEKMIEHGNVSDASFRRADTSKKYGIQSDDGYPFTAPVGRFKPNAFGLLDMVGNVREWVQDWFGPYSVLPRNEPVQLIGQSDNSRVLRGGGWYGTHTHCLSACRFRKADARHFEYGFRVRFRLRLTACSRRGSV